MGWFLLLLIAFLVLCMVAIVMLGMDCDLYEVDDYEGEEYL